MFKDFIHKITKNKYYLIGVISVFLLLVISLGTAALRSTLSIVGTTKIQENTWEIYFDHVHDEQFNDNVTPEKHAVIIDREKTQIEFTVDLKPGEVYEYTVDMINDGSIDASIERVEKTQLTDAQKKYLDFEIQYTEGASAGLEPKTCDTLLAGQSRNIKVSVRYKKGLEVDEYPQQDLHLTLFFNIVYIKRILTCPEEPTAYKLTVDPNGGYFDDFEGADRTDPIVKYLALNSDIYPSTYEIPIPKHSEDNFNGWEVVYPVEGEESSYILPETPNAQNKYNFTIGNEDVKIKALWKQGNYVARIEDKKFETIQMAFDAADGRWTDLNGNSQSYSWHDNTVHLLRDTEEYPTNDTTVHFVFNLESHTVTGRITNSANGKLTLINGRVEEKENNENDDIEGALVNYGIFSLGVDDGVVDVENSVALKGDSIGLYTASDSTHYFNFYDGYIEGDVAYIGKYKGHPTDYYVFINDLTSGDKKIQRAYLVNNASRAVVKTEDEDGSNRVLYYNVQSAIVRVINNKKDNPSLTNYETTLRAIRDFEAAYDITVPQNQEIYFDLENYRIWTGSNVTNNGTFHIYSSNNSRANIKAAKTITNNGTMDINNIKLDATDDIYVISNNGSLDLSNTEVHGQHVYAVVNNGTGTIAFNNKTLIDSTEQIGLYNTSSNLNITDGTIYGFFNEANGAQVTGGNFKIYHWTTPSWSGVNHHYIPAIRNSGTLNVSNGDVTDSEYDTYVVQNKGTINISGGTFDSIYRTFSNNYDNSNGTINITGGNIHSNKNIVYGGNTYISNNASISSDNGSAIEYGYLEVNGGILTTISGNSLNNSSAKITAGEIVSEHGTAVEGNYERTITVTGGTIHSLDGTAIKGTNVNISGGTIEGVTYGIESGVNVSVTGGTITSDDKAVTCTSIDISGGTITSPNDAVNTRDVTVTGGTITSEDGTAITLSGEGTVLDGNIHGGMYGILNNGKLIIGDDEGTISPNVPTIIGESVGVYITGTDTYFFDGILKGQVDGYVGEITRTPLGGTPIGGTEVIDGVTYQTDYIIQFEPWLEIEGVGQFNTINEASDAIADGGTATIKVIKDVVPSFVQHFVDENHNKQITFDLNGHTLRSTQVAYNNDSNVTVIDSVGTGKITNDICNYFENDHNMTINNITIISTGDKAAIRNYRHGTLTITNANITAKTNAIQTMGHTIVNNITLNATQDAIFIECIDELYDHAYGSIEINNGTINAGNRGIYGRGSYTFNGGTLTATKEGSIGPSARVTGGKIHSLDEVAIVGSGITITGGEVIADSNYALYANAAILISGGYVEGTTAIAQYPWYDLYSRPRYESIDITGGKVVGKTGNGINLTGNTLTITGGEVYGEVDGIYSQSHTVIGNNEGVISQTVPLVQGKHNGLTSTGTFYFYDGILKGQNVARDGQVNLVPDASMVKDDYEFIDRVEYKTEYLESFGNWLRVGDQEFNSLYAAQDVIEDYGTVYVTRDVNINFEQSLVEGKHVTFDLDGHQVMMVKTLTTKGTNTVTDSSNAKTGLLRNVSEIEDLAAITNTGNLTITGGQYDATRNYAIDNQGTMIIDGLEFSANGCIINHGYMEFNSGLLSNTSTDRPTIENWWSGGSLKITGGTITSDYTAAINDEGSLIVEGGIITSTVGDAITSSNYYGSTTISGGEITGKVNGLSVSGVDRNDLNITGGIITGETGTGVVSSGWKTYVTGGTLVGKVYGLSLADGGTIGTDDGTVVIDTPIIKGDSYGLNVNQGTLNFNDGILKGVDYSIQGAITNIPAGTQEFNDTEIIDGKTYQTKYLIQEKDLVYNVQKDKRYNNLQTAFDEADNYNVLELLTNIPIYYPVTNNNEHPFTLDLKGYSISTNKPIVNNGKLTLTDSTSTVGSLKTSSSINLISNTNEMVINKVNLINISSSNYIVNNSGTLTLNNTIINGINSVTSSGTLTINNANITGSSTAVSSSGSLTINQGTYKGSTNAIYTNNSGTNTITEATINGRVVNSNGTLEIRKTDINLNSKGDYNYPDETVENSGTIKLLQNTKVLGKGRISNSGTFYMDGITIDITSEKDRTYPVNVIYNSGTMDIDNTPITLEKNVNRNETRGITNTGNLTIHENVTIEIGTHDKNAGDTHYGILTSDNGNTTIDGARINMHGMNTSYAIYVDGNNAKTTMLSGDVNVTDTKYAYGAYTNRATFEMGVSDEIEDASDLVSTTDPRIYSVGDIRGIGVKRVNGNFNFYDGIIWASTYSKPETTTRVQHLYEVTTYMDEATSLEYSLLEFMGDNYDNTVVAMIGQRSYYTLQSAIDAENEQNEEIVLVRSIETEQPLEIQEGKNIVIDLHGMSLTTSINNNGTLQLYNGTIIEVGVDDPETEEVEEHNYINNYGTLIIGKDDGIVSSSNTRIISEGLAINKIYETQYIHNEGRVEMYDGYIEGNPAINGSIDKIAEFARLYTKKDTQYERIYLQSLSEDAIRNKETALIINIDPNGGTYNESEEVQTQFLYFEDELELIPNPTKHASVFDGWEINDPTALIYDDQAGTYKIKVGLKDIELKAKWVVDPNAVAKIGNQYYFSIQEAQDNASDGDIIELIKDYTIEDGLTTTINKEVTIDLGGYTYTGPLINTGILTVYNGTISNPNGTGIVNNKTLTMGINDGEVDIEGTRVYGSTVGLEQNGRFNFYDGNIEGVVAMNGGVHSLPHGYHLYTESIEGNDPPTQRAILTGNPANAVAIIKGTTSDLDQYFFKLTDAISSAALSNKEIDIIRSFNAAYPIEIREEDNIVINMNSYSITTGTTFTVNGALKLYDKSETKGSITFAQTIANNGVLNVEDITLLTNQDRNLLTNNGTLNLTKATLQATTGYAVYYNTGDIIMDADSLLTSNTYALYNNGTLTLSNGEIKGVYNAKDLTLTDNVYLHQTSDNACYSTETDGTVLTTTGGKCVSTNVGIWLNSSTTVNMDNFEITSTNQGLKYRSSNDYYDIGTVNITNSSITSTNSYGIETNDGNYDWRRTITVRDSTITASSHAFSVYCSHNYIYNTSLITTTGAYTAWVDNADIVLYSGSKIESDTANGIYLHGSGYAYLYEDSLIKLTRKDATGVFFSESGYGNLTMKDSAKIEVPGSSSYGVNCTGYYRKIYINGGEIISGNIGLRMRSYYNSNYDYTNEININGGSISGENYGIYTYANEGNVPINIGKNADPLNQQVPYITGGLYGIYKEAATVNIYNGRVRGYVDAYNGSYNKIKDGYDVAILEESVDAYNHIRTFGTSNTSEEPVEKYAKSGNGYAKLTYIDEDNGTCINGTVTTYNYTGHEEVFTATCAGKYKLEVWGASGGRATYGYGGYSYGEIDLAQNEKLYINVGGQGGSTTNANGGAGGYNGGGAGGNGTCGYWGGQGGGGATHIATSTGLLSDLDNNRQAVIIVAGGGGGSVADNWYNRRGGSGGGYIGSDGQPYDENYAMSKGGTQESGYAFGQGANGANGLNCSGYSAEGNGGSGGGWYGGTSTATKDRTYQDIPGSGGSGYIGNSRLTNKAMYGYNVIATPSQWIHHYLVEKEHFIQTDDGETFNSINAAATHIKDNLGGTGKMLIIANAELREEATLPSGTTIEIDLNGKHLSNNQSINNAAALTISDSSTGHTGLFENTASNLINHTGSSLTIEENVHLKSAAIAIYSTKDGTTITQKAGSVITGNIGYKFRNSTTFNMTSAEINTTNTGIDFGTDNWYMIANLNITNSTIISTNEYAINTYSDIRDWAKYLNIKGSTIKGKGYAVLVRGANLTAENTTFESTGGDYAIQVDSGNVTLNSGAKIESDVSQGIYLYYNGHAIMNNGSLIKLSRENGNGIYLRDAAYSNVRMNTGSKIDVSGTSSYGINWNSYYSKLYIDGGEIKSGNIGIRMRSYYNSNYDYTNELNVYSGNIEGSLYGIYTYTNDGDLPINIGKDSDPLSQNNPLISGGTRGIYKEAGTINFFNGRIRGTEYANNGDFSKLKHGMKVVSIDEYEDPLDETSTLYHSKYLERLEDFLITQDGEEFNSINDAVDYIKENFDGTGTVTVTRDATMQEVSTIPADTVITLDLNGKHLTSNQSVNNNGDFTISDSSTGHTGLFENTATNLINHTGSSLTIEENVHLKSAAIAIYSTKDGTTITQKAGSVITGNIGYKFRNSTTFNMTSAEINTTNTGIDFGTDNWYMIANLNITNSTIISTNEYAINTYSDIRDWAKYLNIKGSTIKGKGYAVLVRGANLTAENTTFESTGGDYAIQVDSGNVTLNSGAKIESDVSQGIYLYYNGHAIMNNGSLIKLSRENGNGIYLRDAAYSNVRMNTGSKIDVSGTSSYGINWNSYYSKLYIDGGEIKSGNIGIRMRSYYNSNHDYTNEINVYGGSIEGAVYGIYTYTHSGDMPINIGKKADPLDQNIPYITGGLYGIYRDAGSLNFYNGRLRGGTAPFNGDVANVRDDHQVYLTNDDLTSDEMNYKTYSTSTFDATPVAKTPKKGDGYARIKYVSDNDQVIDYEYADILSDDDAEFTAEYFDYTGGEETFTVPEDGLYTLESWGAQGGGSGGGYGGYTRGQIYLNKNDVLYINVGGKGAKYDGGYNGGGTGGAGNGQWSYGGGGATSITTTSGELNQLSDKLDKVIMIAAGGGGNGGSSPDAPGGSGGGFKGTNGYDTVNHTYYAYTGIGANYDTPGYAYYCSGVKGSFGQGANYCNSGYGGAGGGGGYFGGGGSDRGHGGGGGGSSYIANTNLVDKYTYCYNCETTNDESKKTISNGTDSCHSSSPNKDCAKEGNGYVKITKASGDIYNVDKEYDYTAQTKTYNAIYNGVYKLEVWGAQGGSVTSNPGGYGSYSVGEITLNRGDVLYVNVGGKGISTNTGLADGGFNGGGQASSRDCGTYTNRWAGSGGGATSITKVPGELSTLEAYKGTLNDNGTDTDDSDDYYESNDILIVAGGGGGGYNNNNYIYGKGGSAGGIVGYRGNHNNISATVSQYAQGGTQTKGGYPGNSYEPITNYDNYDQPEGWVDIFDGDFGQGGKAAWWECGDSAGGGGGFYGGGGGLQTAGGAGSGYIASPSLSEKHMYCYNCTTSENVNTKTISNGSSSCHSSSPDADCAKENNGYAKITLLSTEDTLQNTITFVYDHGQMDNDTMSFDMATKVGVLPVPYNYGNYYFDGWFTDTTYTKKVNKDTIIKSDVRIYAKFIPLSEFCNNSYTYDFEYTGGEQVYTASCTGKYTLETWGASGGSYSTRFHGGYGGYSVGSINLTAGDTLYINVGGQGSSVTGTRITANGGYNGGGTVAINYSSTISAGSGGGATSIAKASGLLSSLANNKSSVIMVAGGGAGSSYYYDSNSGYGGSGGGYLGGTGESTCGSAPGTGGSQEGPGHISGNYSAGLGSFGQGASNEVFFGAGGGGYYGGGYGSDNANGGGGGSGYIGNSDLYDKAMYGYNVREYAPADHMTIAYLIPTSKFIRNKTIDESYSNLTEAYSYASDGDEFELIEDASITMASTMANVRTTLDLAGHDLYIVKTITNNGDLTIVNNDTTKDPKIYANFSINMIDNKNKLTINDVKLQGYNVIVNSGTLELDGVTITSTNNAINTSHGATITDSNITASNYAYYESGSTDSSITGTVLKGAVQHESTGGITLSTTPVTGNINNTAGIFNISGQPIKGTIGNSAKMNISGLTITSTDSGYYTHRMVSNSGTMTLSNNTLTTNNTYNSDYTVANVYNSGTLESIGNNYTAYSSGRYKYVISMENTGILTTKNDVSTGYNGRWISSIHNSSTGTVNATNLTSTIYNGDDVSTYNHRSGSMTITGGTYEIYNSTNANGIIVNDSTVNVKGGTYSIHDISTGNGIYINNNGTANVEDGSFDVSGATVYGVRIASSNATLNLGVSGVPVNKDSPYISAVGTTKGIGISMGNGSFYFYDGKITANTSVMDANNLETGVETNYQVVNHPADADNPYPYNTLEIIY